IDRGLGVVALDVTVLGLQDAAFRVGEIALRLAVGLRFRRRLAALLAAFGVQRGLGLAYLLKPFLLVGHPIGHLVAALVAVELVLLRIGGLGGLEPAI